MKMDAMKDGGDIPVADLLAQTGWLRSLARGLVSDEALAEDLVQESLLTAVERPPRRPGALRSWLRTVLRRQAARARHQGASRARRERAAARPERSDLTPAEVLERVELQGQMVDLVLSLEEPYRSAILLRYFEDWSADEIGRRQGVDATTVRWRLRKAVERLRERLDRANGSRAAWSAALAPLLLVGRGSEAAAVSAAAASELGSGAAPSLFFMAARELFSGVAIMKLKAFAIALILSLLLLGLLFQFVGRRPVEPAAAPSNANTAVARAPAPPAPPREEPRKSAQAKPEPKAEVKPVANAGAVVVGLVTDRETGDPIAAAVVYKRGSDARAVTGDDGTYRMEGLAAGEHYLVAGAGGYAEEHARSRIGAAEEFRQDFVLEGAIDLLVTVVDTAGKPIEGVRVTAAQPAGDYVYEGYAKLTDAEGHALLSGIGRERMQQINAKKDGYQEVWSKAYEIEADRDQSELSIVLKERLAGDGVVVGTVTGPDKQPLVGIHVQWIHSHGEHKGRVVVDTARDGSYRLEFPRTGDWCAVSAYGEGYVSFIREGVRPGNAEEPARVDFALSDGHRLQGEVVDEDGRPVEGAVLIALRTIWNLRNTPLHAGNARTARTDAQGRFALEDLAAPTTALQIKGPPGGSWANNFLPEVEVDRRVTLRLLRWGIIRGRVLDRESGEPVPVFGIKLKKGVGYYDYTRCDPGEFFNSAAGQFLLKKLDQGAIEFLIEADGYIPKWVRELAAEPEADAPLHEVRITRGRFLEGTVVDAASSAPLAEARVVFGSWEGSDLAWDEGSFKKMADRQEAKTGPDGAFRVREGEPGTLFVQRAGYARIAVPPLERLRLLDASGRIRVALDRGGSLRGVLYEDGKPSKQGFLVLYRKRSAGDGGREWIGNLERDAEGRFQEAGLPAGDYFIEHWRETPGKRTAGLSIQRTVRIEPGEESSIEFGGDMGPLAFQGRLLGPDGKPLERVRLTLRPELEWTYIELAATVTAEHEGRFHFLGLRPGKYRVEVTHPDGRTTELPGIAIDADLEQDFRLRQGE